MFEKTVYTKIFQYFTINIPLYVIQCGLRAEYSTELALTELIDRIYLDLHENRLPIAIFIACQKDLTPEHYGIKIY